MSLEDIVCLVGMGAKSLLQMCIVNEWSVLNTLFKYVNIHGSDCMNGEC